MTELQGAVPAHHCSAASLDRSGPSSCRLGAAVTGVIRMQMFAFLLSSGIKAVIEGGAGVYGCWMSVCAGPGDDVPAVYGLNATDSSRWEEAVLTPALQILESLRKVWLQHRCWSLCF